MLVRFVLFDLDGTLCDSSEGILRCFRYAFEKMGLQSPSETALRSCIGPPLYSSFLSFFGGDEESALTGVNFYRERYAVKGWRECSLYPGVEECLGTLVSQGKKAALATSKPQPFAEKILKNFGLEKYFSVTVGSRLDNSFDDKGEIVALAMKKLNAAAEETAMVGDREQDVVGALKNGATPIGIRTGFAKEGELEAAGAKYVVKNFFELARLLSVL